MSEGPYRVEESRDTSFGYRWMGYVNEEIEAEHVRHARRLSELAAMKKSENVHRDSLEASRLIHYHIEQLSSNEGS